MLNEINLQCLPIEIVNEIADYHDYEKYFKPIHQKKFKHVIYDIYMMGGIMNPISAKIARECWGSKITHNLYDTPWEAIFYFD